MDQRWSRAAVTLSTHVLDIARGLPAAGIAITLYAIDGDMRVIIATALTNADGRTDHPLATNLAPGSYEIVFAAGPYFVSAGVTAFYTDVPVRFTLDTGGDRYHVPLLLAPWGYSTYRGS